MNTMYKASPVYFLDVNERAAHVKIDCVCGRCLPGPY